MCVCVLCVCVCVCVCVVCVCMRVYYLQELCKGRSLHLEVLDG